MQRLQPVPPQAPKLLKSRPTQFAVKKNNPTTGNFLDSQEWLQERFEGLASKDVSDQYAAIYTAKELAAPLGFLGSSMLPQNSRKVTQLAKLARAGGPQGCEGTPKENDSSHTSVFR